MTCKRSTNGEWRTNLLPPEYTVRYKQRFNERLIMGALGALFIAYVGIVALYVGWTQFVSFRYDKKAEGMAKLGMTYTNTLQLKEHVRVLQDQVDLQYAALECYKAVADYLPSELTLDAVNFDQGRKLSLNGTAGNTDRGKVVDFMDQLRKIEIKGQPLFKNLDGPRTQLNAGNQVTWSFSCELKRADE